MDRGTRISRDGRGLLVCFLFLSGRGLSDVAYGFILSDLFFQLLVTAPSLDFWISFRQSLQEYKPTYYLQSTQQPIQSCLLFCLLLPHHLSLQLSHHPPLLCRRLQNLSALTDEDRGGIFFFWQDVIFLADCVPTVLVLLIAITVTRYSLPSTRIWLNFINRRNSQHYCRN